MQKDTAPKRKTLEERDPLSIALGDRIRALRETKGIAQEIFAYEAGINRSYYGAIERGMNSPTASSLAKIALRLEVEVGELFPGRAEIMNLLKPSKEGDQEKARSEIR